MVRFLFLVMWLVLTTSGASAEDLLQAVQTGRVQILALNGTGASSGASLQGLIKNNTLNDIQLDTILPNPIYFDNGSDGQNMVATQVYMSDGGYYTQGARSFIELKSGTQAPVLFVAYCADFELDNPSRGHNFSVAPFPGNLAQVARKISAYEAAQSGMDLTVAAQVALWIAVGVSPEHIAEKFAYSENDLNIAYSMLR